jgi:hypothetical protein
MDRRARSIKATEEKTIEKLPPTETDIRSRWSIGLGAVAFGVVIVAFLAAGVTVGYLLLIFVCMFIGGQVRRPWIVEAFNRTSPEQSAAFAVKGWQRSEIAIDSIAREIEESGPPERITISA